MKNNIKRSNKMMKPWMYCMGGALCLLAVTAGCTSKEVTEDEKEGVETVLPSAPNEVTVMPLRRVMFEHELVSNGKVTASEYADLSFQTSAVVERIYVKNGDRVAKGQKLAELDRFKLRNALEQAKNSLAQSELDLKDVLISQGYSPSQMDKVPAEIMRLAGIKSGYEQSKARHELAQHEYDHATLTAPFAGVVANLFDKAQNPVSTSAPFCRVINTAAMEVDFSVLESELPLLKVGDRVTVTPYTSNVGSCRGEVVSINPLVDEQSMVRVKARIEGRTTALFDGMNVKVSVHREVGDALVIPKTAVVLRSGKQVVFTLKNGQAQWNYVQTVLENLENYTLSESGENVLHEGDTVIVTGNLNLAHEAPVKVIE